jgi:Ser/Thr protein kinase RdoA (MazF antagonist)
VGAGRDRLGNVAVDTIAGLIRDETARSKTSAVEQAVFGTTDPEVIASAFDALLRASCGAPIQPLAYRSSVGCVLEVELADGVRVVVKAYQARWHAPFLAAVHRVQHHLLGRGIPCPEPVAGPLPILRGLALIDARLPDPGIRPPTPTMLPISAAGLADVIHASRGVDPSDLSPHPMDASDQGGLYPTPHSPIFDFGATVDGAEWIDELASAAREVRDERPGERVIAHSDWSARNVRMDEQRLLAVYDWDSLAVVPEPVAVGQAAATWSAIDDGQPAPTCQEIAAYAYAYERARGRPFTEHEMRTLGAAALYVLAYTARCEHAVDPDEQVHRRARPRLRVDGTALLDLPGLVREDGP